MWKQVKILENHAHLAAHMINSFHIADQFNSLNQNPALLEQLLRIDKKINVKKNMAFTKPICSRPSY